MAEKKVRAILVIEAMGRPAEYLKESLVNHIAVLKKDKDVEFISEKYHESKKMEQINEEMYTCFAEIEIKAVNFLKMMHIVFDYMPASIEILEPETLQFELSESNSLINELSGKLHRYDEITKVAQMQSQQLANKFKVMQKVLADNNINFPELVRKSQEKMENTKQAEEKIEQKETEDRKEVKKKKAKKK